MTPRLFIEPEAAAEIQAAADWYEARATGLGREFLRAVRVGLAAIERQPGQFPAVHGEIRRAMLRRFPCGLYFVTDGNRVAEKEEFLVPLGISQSEFARHAEISFPRINEICNGRRGVATDTAMRFERLTGMPATFWLELQLAWDLWHTAQSPAGKRIARLRRLAKIS